MKHYNSIAQVQSDINSGVTTCLQLVNDYLERIENNLHLNAFLEVFTADALEQAKQVDAKIKAGTAGRLAGAVIGLKDNIVYKGHHISASSKILGEFESLYSATATERLLAEDAIIIGRLNCDEFAMGSSNENSAFGPVLNPLDNTKVTGGSSGGSAAAVAAGLCLATLGSDTGGSIRQPASFCGVVGLKPTYGVISRWGLIAYGSSLDQIGTFTNSIEDAAILTEIMAGKDEFDSTMAQEAAPQLVSYLSEKKTYKIGYLKEAIEHPGLNKEVQEKMIAFIEQLKADGHTVEPVSFPYLDYMVPTYYIISTAEASSNLSRFDGIRYGYRSSAASDIRTTYIKSRSEGFGEEVKRRIMLGTFVLSAGYYDAYYAKAQKVRRLIKDKTEVILSEYDFVLSPTTPHPAFNLGENTKDPIKMYLEDIFTIHANLAGCPAISLPLIQHSSGMPVGVQLLSARFTEQKLLSFSNQLMNK